MSILPKSENNEMRALIQLLKAFTQKKAALCYEISKIKIKNSYRQSNSEFRDIKDMLAISKLLHKRLHEIKVIRNIPHPMK